MIRRRDANEQNETDIERWRHNTCVGPGMSSPELVEFFGYLGFDDIFLDAEHGVIGVDRAQEMVRAADGSGTPTLTRVPQNDPVVIRGDLESGTGGVIVPHVNTADDARAAVQAAKYAPLGTCGAGTASRAANFGPTRTAAEYLRRANEETFLSALVEESEGVRNLDAIMAVEGVDAVGIGAGNLSMSMGLPGQASHPDVKKIVLAAEARVAAAGKIAVTFYEVKVAFFFFPRRGDSKSKPKQGGTRWHPVSVVPQRSIEIILLLMVWR
jgi:2-keto-3-deoxy-L-rhamnonate aldolase RhmA